MPRHSKGEHTILFLQQSKNPASRTYLDFEDVDLCMESVCKIFEDYLKATNPTRSTITYNVHDLFEYIDKLPDLSVLVQTDNGRYAPWGKKWIKTKLFEVLRSQAAK